MFPKFVIWIVFVFEIFIFVYGPPNQFSIHTPWFRGTTGIICPVSEVFKDIPIGDTHCTEVPPAHNNTGFPIFIPGAAVSGHFVLARSINTLFAAAASIAFAVMLYRWFKPTAFGFAIILALYMSQRYWGA